MSIVEDYAGEYTDDEINDALQKANNALETVYTLKTIDEVKKDEEYSITETKAVNIAIESFHKYHPGLGLEAALEDIDDGTPVKTTGDKIKKTIDYLFSIARNILTFFIDYIRNNKLKAKKYIATTKELIGRSDSLNGSSVARIEQRSLIASLHVDGGPPIGLINLYQKVIKAVADQRKYAGVTEIGEAVSAARRGDIDTTTEAVEKLRSIYENGFKTTMKPLDNPHRSFAFNEVRQDCDYYLSEPYFGGRHVCGHLSKEVKKDGTMLIDSTVKNNPETPVRISHFDSLSPDSIREVCRDAHKFCASVISNTHDEVAIARLLREATFVSGTKASLTTVIALRSIASVGKGPFLVHLRFAMAVTRSLLAYCEASVQAYEKTEQGT